MPLPGALAAMTQLMMKLGDDPRVIALPPEPITVGRSSQNAIAIMDASLSRVHCELRRVDGVVQVKDMGSRNGTLVNGANVKEARVKGGDRIDVGICRIHVVAEGSDFKLEVSAGKGTSAPAAGGGDTRQLRESAKTIENLSRGGGARSDVVGWGKRTGSNAGVIAGSVFLVLAIGVAALVLKGKKETGKKDVIDPWAFDYPAGADFGKDWRAAPGTSSAVALAPGRNGNGLEVSRKPGEHGLGEAWGPRKDVAARKAYRLSAWAKPAGGSAGLRIGWCRTPDDKPFAWSGTGLFAEGGDIGGTWRVPEGALFAQISFVAAGDAPRAVFDDVEFAESPLADQPPVAGRTVKGLFEAPGVFFFASRESDVISAAVGVEGADASCSIDAKRTAGGATYGVANPSGSGAAVTVEETRDAEGEGFSLHFRTKGSPALLFLSTPSVVVEGHTVTEFEKTGRATVGRSGARVALELRPEAEVGSVDGRVVVRFPGEDFEIAFLPEGAGKVQAGLEEASKAEDARQFGKALALYEGIVEKNPKGELGQAAAERAEAVRAIAEETLRKARDLRSDAEFSGRAAGCDEAVREYQSVEAEFDGTEYAAQARAEREATEELRKVIASEMSDSGVGRLLAAAEAYLNEGRLALARAFCEAVQDRTSDPDATAAVESLLQRIASKESDR